MIYYKENIKKKGGEKKIAKILGSLFSFGSSGAIGKNIIVENRKYIKTVKSYSKPKNPQTVIQQGQRSFMTEANLAWHNDGYTPEDIEAWENYTRSIKINATGFNMFARFKINAAKDSKQWTKLVDCIISDITGNGCKVEINIDSDQNGVLWYGVKNNVILSQNAGVFAVNKYTFILTGLTLLTRYYFYIKNMSPGENAITGIYSFKTTSIVSISWFQKAWFYGWFNYDTIIFLGWFNKGWFIGWFN